ncbi:asparagine synthase (glutamine-hydrolyzing) [bacterium]|nr:asparagine synthase (glutamine-hydrolyzing) [bacterium]
MCGIYGEYSSSRPVSKEEIMARRDTLVHRGPDGGGVWISPDQTVALAHRRLAILDLSDSAAQPMVSRSEKTILTFNGEIYNHRELRRELEGKGHSFSSHSDTEVLLNAYEEWGEGCCSHLKGMFAFALYDGAKNTLFLARDRVGEKPLFYYHHHGSFRFASELKALLHDPEMPRKLNAEAFDCLLTFGYVPGEHCLLQHYRKLPPASCLRFSLSTKECHRWRYWEPPSPGEDYFGEEVLLERLEQLLGDAVASQLVADVPVGVLLSGGLDSSLITALAAERCSSLRTFTVKFPGHGALDETPHARAVAEYFGTAHEELDGNEIQPHLLEQAAVYCDEPVFDSSLFPTMLLSEAVRKQCTVVLGGDGGDELFGGYKHYLRYARLQKQGALFPKPLKSFFRSGALHLLPEGMRGRGFLLAFLGDYRSAEVLGERFFDPVSKLRLTGGVLTSVRGVAQRIWRERTPQNLPFDELLLRQDFQNYLPEDILVKVDRSSMRSSLEVRAPFLDRDLVEFAFRDLPTTEKFSSTERKILLKKLARKKLPPSFQAERKQGFSIPLATWLKQSPWRDTFHDILLSPDPFFSPSRIRTLLAQQDRGYSHSERLFGLALFKLWSQHYRVVL